MTRGIDRAVCAASLVIAFLALFAAIRWMRAHPYPIWWDEANYVNQVFDDRQAFLRGGAVAELKSLLFADNERPPAYRAIVAPVAAATLPSLALLRAIALCVTLAGLALLWRACRRVASLPSSLLATVMVLAIPEVLASGSWFATEYALMLAVALLLDSIVRRSPVGVAAGVALGLLAKSSFVFIGAPAMLVALITARADCKEVRRLLVASTCGVLVAMTWWSWNAASALQFAQLGRTFERLAFGDPFSLAALAEKLRRLGVGLGFGFASSAVLVCIAALRDRRLLSVPIAGSSWPAVIPSGARDLGGWGDRHELSHPTRPGPSLDARDDSWPLTSEIRRAVLVGVAASMPLLLMAFFSPVFVARHFAPALLALTLPLAILLDRVRPAMRLAVAVLMLIQVVTIAPFLPRVEQTDWTRLRAAVPTTAPRIAFLGGWPSLSPPEIRYAWTQAGDEASVLWLWRAEERAIDWTNVMREVMRSDAVLVVPPAAVSTRHDYERTDNRHNAELIARLSASEAFAEPVPFRVGTYEPVDALLFVHRRAAPAARR